MRHNLTPPPRIRQARPTDKAAWLRLRHRLWPHCPDDKHDLETDQLLKSKGVVFVAEDKPDNLIGFVEVSLRADHVDGASISPVPYLEGWFVDEPYRKRGVGRALLAAVEQWAVSQGYTELASDAEIENPSSLRLHQSVGFHEVGRNVHFLKPLPLKAPKAINQDQVTTLTRLPRPRATSNGAREKAGGRGHQTGEKKESLEERVRRTVREEIIIVPYDPRWPELFRREKDHLLAALPEETVRRIEHYGSTAVPGLAAKPIVDLLVEVTSLDETKRKIVPVLEAQGYEYFWRPTIGDDGPPFYAWFIKRNAQGVRTHHIHMVEQHFPHWDGLLFRDYLILHPAIAKEYEQLKLRLAREFPNDREAYTRGKTEFILRITEQAKQFFGKLPPS